MRTDCSVEDRVKNIIRLQLESEGWKVKPEVAVVDSDRNVVLDFYAFKEGPQILWIECKGNVNLSELIEGFARLEFALFYGGGKGLFCAPVKQIRLMEEFGEYFKQVSGIELCAITLSEN